MRQKLRQKARRPSAEQHARGVTPGERRGDLLGAEPGPGPSRPRRQPSSACKFVLVGLANHAGPDGTGAFPSGATLVRYTGLSERTVRTCLDQLQAEGIIWPCDPDIAAARIKRADRRPQGWDFNLSLARDDLNAAAVAASSSSSQGWAPGSPGLRSPALTASLTGCNHRTRLPPAARLWITGRAGCCSCTPRRELGATCAPTGCN
jgi:helix-turn-helix protein